ncbi:MAG TPA: ThuA domain-containing protein [Kiritimatiellia bacterium]|nr:ThuA domain-containing protein [Kiritimatiellia bacterium]HMP33724.1 ThuA domain-containing protein [Kiritimatiellia bacterium]
MEQRVRVCIWNEFVDERVNDVVRAVYPDGIHAAIARGLAAYPGLEVSVATLDEPEQGLSEERLAATDVLVWWGHRAHDAVSEETVARVQRQVWAGMGFIGLHSAHYAKVFRALMGTSCTLSWRVDGGCERVWVVAPSHPIAAGLGDGFVIPQEEMYGEAFDVPEPDELVFLSWFPGGEVFRSGCCWRRGNGRVFYFRPGHETFPTYHQPEVIRVIANAAHWAAPGATRTVPGNRHRPAAG